MTDEITKIEKDPVELTASDLMKIAEILLKMWTEAENEKHKRELEYETTVLKEINRQNRLTTIGLFAVTGFVLCICVVLFFLGRDSTAMDLIKLVIGLGGALLGGYGYAMRKRQLGD